MHYLYKLTILFLFTTIQSCQLIPNYPSSAETILLSDEQEQVFNLLRQGKRYDELSKLHRRAVCKRLQLDYYAHADWQSAWLLAYSLNENFNCVTLNKALKLLKDIQIDKNANAQLQWLNKNQIKLLVYLNNVQKNRNRLRKQLQNSKKQLKNLQEQLTKENNKIEALKAIETSINKKLENE